MSKTEIPIFQDFNPNPCLDQCPQSSCCRDMNFFYLEPDDLVKLIKDNTYSRKCDSLMEVPTKERLDMVRSGVYYAKTGKDTYRAFLAGPCPNLDEKKECTIYEDRPIPCSRLVPGDETCNSVREKDRLPAIINT